MLKLYIIGISILVVAIFANFLAAKLGLLTWYDFLKSISEKGFQSVTSAGLVNLLWLFILYPLSLGLGYWLGDKLFNLLF